jgi:ribosome-binding ATPase YchF (GTP1/OBG family)
MSAANLKIAEQYIHAFAQLARTNNTLIVPSNVSDIAGLVASAMTVLAGVKTGAQRAKAVSA